MKQNDIILVKNFFWFCARQSRINYSQKTTLTNKLIGIGGFYLVHFAFLEITLYLGYYVFLEVIY